MNSIEEVVKKNPAIGSSWEEVEKRIFTPVEIAESDLRVALILELINARRERGLSQQELAELSGVKQPVIARIERCQSIPNLNTIIKILVSLGKTLTITPLPK